MAHRTRGAGSQLGSGAGIGLVSTSTFSSVTRPPGWASETTSDTTSTIAMPISTA